MSYEVKVKGQPPFIIPDEDVGKWVGKARLWKVFDDLDEVRAFQVEAHRTERGIALTLRDGPRRAELKIELIEPKMLLVYKVLGRALAEKKI